MVQKDKEKKDEKKMENNQPTQPTDGTTQKQIPGTTTTGEPDFLKIKEKESEYLKLSELKEGEYVMTFLGQKMQHRTWTDKNTGKSGEVDELVLTTEAPTLFDGQKTLAVTWLLEVGKKALLYQLKQIALARASQNLIGVQIALKVEKGKDGKNHYSVFWLNKGK